MMPSETYPSSADNVRMERHAVVRSCMQLLTSEHPGVDRADVRRTVALILLDSVQKQARWSAGLETDRASG